MPDLPSPPPPPDREPPEGPPPAGTHGQPTNDSPGSSAAQPEARSGNGMAVAGFVLSLCSLVLFWFVGLNFVLLILAAVFSALGLRRSRTQQRPRRGLAVAGLAIAAAAAAASIAFTAWIVTNYDEDTPETTLEDTTSEPEEATAETPASSGDTASPGSHLQLRRGVAATWMRRGRG